MMGSVLGQYLDVIIAGALLLVGGVIFLLSRINILPKKSLPYVAAAIAGAVGLGIFSQWRRSKLIGELDERKKKADERKKELDTQKQELERLSARVDEKKSEVDARDAGLAVLEGNMDAARQKVAQAEAALTREYQSCRESVLRAAEEKRAEFDRIEKEAVEMDDQQLLQALLDEALKG